MLASAAKKLDIKTIIFCDDENAPGQKFSDKFIFADYSDDKAINEFATSENYDLILYQDAAFVSDQVNITNQILLRIKGKLP